MKEEEEQFCPYCSQPFKCMLDMHWRFEESLTVIFKG
jgi:hypothetical protein